MRVGFGLFLAATISLSSSALPVCAYPAQQSSKSQVVSDPETRIVRVSASDLHSFDTTITSLAEQTGLTVLAEGVPVHARIPEAKIVADFSAGPTLSQVLGTIAELYDYDADFSQPGFLLLRKRFADINDVPEVTVAEYIAALQNIKNILSPFDPKVPPVRLGTPNPLVGEFANALSADQTEELRQGRLTMSALPLEQQARLQRALMYVYVQSSLAVIDQTLTNLQDCPRGTLGFRPYKPDSPAARPESFGADKMLPANAPKPKAPTLLFVCGIPDAVAGSALVNASHDSIKPGTTKRRGHFLVLGNVFERQPNSLPSSEAGDKAASNSESPKSVTTLTELVSFLNSNSTGQSAQSMNAAVAEMLGAKRVCVARSSGSLLPHSEGWLAALARMYGLQIVSSQGKRLLARRDVPSPSNPNEISKSVSSAVPLPLLRSLKPEMALPNPEELKLPDDFNKRPAAERSELRLKLAQKLKERDELLMAAQQRPSLLSNTAVDQLMRGVDDEAVKEGKDRAAIRVSVASLPASDQCLLAIALSKQALELMNNRFSYVPTYLGKFSELTMTGGPEIDAHGYHRFTIGFAYIDSRGNRHTVLQLADLLN